jgi:hypothetical protein
MLRLDDAIGLLAGINLFCFLFWGILGAPIRELSEG